MLVMTELLLVMLPEARHERNVDSFGPLHVDILVVTLSKNHMRKNIMVIMPNQAKFKIINMQLSVIS